LFSVISTFFFAEEKEYVWRIVSIGIVKSKIGFFFC